ncbi:hypothetical protein TNCV_3223801 [Trichonephila clavipes]|nr:hypothetical protein TNCV_3223801 [Trichonephila clavipes]
MLRGLALGIPRQPLIPRGTPLFHPRNGCYSKIKDADRYHHEAPRVGRERRRFVGRGSLVVKVTWLTCHEFEPSTAEDPPCRGGQCTLNLSRIKCPPVGVQWKLGEVGASQLRCRSRHLTEVQNYEVRHHYSPGIVL